LNAEVDDLKILFVDDDALDIVYEKYELERNGITFASRVAASELEVIHELAEFAPDVVLCDYTMRGFAGPRALDTLLRLRPATPVLMVSGSIDDDTANQCLKGGATDYVLKENLGRLGPAVRRAVGNARHRQALESRIDELSNCHTDGVVQLGHVRSSLESSLRDAIHREQLELYYQPQYDIRSGQACGVEALARWFPADGVSIAPSTFIPLAEQAGLIEPLGAWALRTATMAAAEWLDDTSRPPLVCVNVSPLQICEGFTTDIAQALEASGLPPDRLELEITESVLVTNIDLALKCLAEWKTLGVRIALDDFGTGYSSLSYLTRLPIDRLKIDGSLIRGMTTDSRDTIIVRAVISLCREFGFTTLAEGVETDVQFAMLDDLGCEQVQGYLLARPAPLTEARELMRRCWGARPDASVQGAAVKTTHAWPSLKAPEGANDSFADLRAAYFTRLRSDLAQLATLRAKLAGAGTGSKTAYASIRRIAHGMAGAAAIFKAGDVMRAAMILEQAVRVAATDGDAVRLALDTMIESLRPICNSN
jgi:EAL domain-containing protein (putative c-di-GMP-specific phosphodiesterase class I)/FixJ family two-component response regulator/HPt (histidine-containing phosphotransfer) domain-containing protein